MSASYIKNYNNDTKNDLTTGDFVLRHDDIPLVEIKNKEIGKQVFRSKLIIGNIEIANIKTFNKIQKYLFKKLLGIEIIDI